MTKALFMIGAASALVLSAPAMAAEQVTNGSFENGTTSGWNVTSTSGTAPQVIAYGQASGYPTGAFGEAVPAGTGNFGLLFSSDTANPDRLWQMVNVVKDMIYTISFDYYVPLNGYNNPYDATLALFAGNTQLGSTIQAGSAGGVAPQQWQTFTTNYTATSNGNVKLALQFNGLGNTAADFVVDNISMTQAVPEPATWAMMLAGFGIAGASLRRRKTVLSFA